MQNKCSDTAETTVHSLLSTIKRELHANMNGVASAAMRQTDDYRVNFGVELPRLQGIAKEFGKDHQLAQALWKESVRECRILAAMIQPVDTFCPEIADIWVESIRTAEIAQTISLLLFKDLPYASDKAFQWIASDNEIQQICGFSTICHLIRKNELQERSVDELKDQAEAAMNSSNLSLRKLANNVLASLSERYGSVSQ
jgi:3-methyladenine DNA glycosylase AlkD